jgi:Uma2 family endonuclease
MSTAAVSSAPEAAPRPRQARPATFTVVLFEREVVVPASAESLDGFRAWALSDDFPQRGRFSYLDGEVYIDMSPEELETHNKIKVEIGRVLPNVTKKNNLGQFYADRALLTNVAANLSTEPDALFATWETLKSKRLRMVPRKKNEEQSLELEGAPDWVLEIVSDSSVRKDTKLLRKGYFLAGVSEYWLIDARGGEIDFQMLVRGATDFEAVAEQKGWLASPLFKRRFRLTRQRDPLSLWGYTLEVKPRR